MTNRIKRSCRKTGCSGTTIDKSGFCDKCKSKENGWRQWAKNKGNSMERGYGSEWRRLRIEILKRDNYMCQEHIKEGLFVLGNNVDHIIPKSQYGSDSPSNLQVLCKPCHDKKTALEQTQPCRGGGG